MIIFDKFLSVNVRALFSLPSIYRYAIINKGKGKVLLSIDNTAHKLRRGGQLKTSFCSD